ncbi:MAG: hypothetical protein LBS32_03515 [Clostridiales Family XIII bacterium]|nr:hypothetical protein [Clostridiales Family XIII bacterium]
MKKGLFLVVLPLAAILALSACSDRASQVNAGTGAVNGLAIEDMEGGQAEADTPPDQVSGLAVGDSIWTNSMKITLNSIEIGPEASDGSDSYRINATYENHGETMNSVSPFDWSTVEADGTVVGFDMEGKGSFNLVTLPEQKKFTGDVILFRTENSKEVQFKATLKWSDIPVTWAIDI